MLSGDRVLARRVEPMERGQAERLLPLLEEVLAEAGAGWADLAALAVCTGPGNFTGLRIGVAAARGLALALDRPAIGVTRLEALAEGATGPALVGDRRAGATRFYVQDFRRRRADRAAGADRGLGRSTTRAPGRATRLGAAAARRPRTAAPTRPSLARIAARRLGSAAPPPAPLYLRPADAAPAAEPPPRAPR